MKGNSFLYSWNQLFFLIFCSFSCKRLKEFQSKHNTLLRCLIIFTLVPHCHKWHVTSTRGQHTESCDTGQVFRPRLTTNLMSHSPTMETHTRHGLHHSASGAALRRVRKTIYTETRSNYPSAASPGRRRMWTYRWGRSFPGKPTSTPTGPWTPPRCSYWTRGRRPGTRSSTPSGRPKSSAPLCVIRDTSAAAPMSNFSSAAAFFRVCVHCP